MGLLQKAVETYNTHEARAGKEIEGHRPLAPISHTVKNADIEITLNEQGEIQSACVVDKSLKATIIPVTEASAGRSGKSPAAHPLCDQVQYLSGEDEVRYALYISQLKEWADSEFSHPMLKPILTYVLKRSLRRDLDRFGIKISEKKFIRWRVNGIGDESGACWTNENLFHAFEQWYRSVRKANSENAFCMVSGQVSMPALQHLKGVVPSRGNAKLISTNDTSGFTYLGRFTSTSQAISVSYDASQKAHNALQWLVAEQGSKVTFLGRTFLCWNPRGKEVPHCVLPIETRETEATTPTDYKKELQRTIEGWRVQLPENSGGVLIAAFDSSTKGRLSLAYYNELMASDFLQRLYDWDESCCWWDYNPTSGRFDAIRSPSFRRIIQCAYGTQREEKKKMVLEVDQHVVDQEMQRLVVCRVDRMLFPEDLMRSLVQRASTPQVFEKSLYEKILRTACAAVKKYYHDHKKEELPMTLEEERKDRSYQFGRLLAVLDRAEEEFYRKQADGQKDNEHRQTNAMRYMTKFAKQPLSVYVRIHNIVTEAYLPRIDGRKQQQFKKLNAGINEILRQFPVQEMNKPLKETYLMGFYHQRNKFYQTKDETEQEEA